MTELLHRDVALKVVSKDKIREHINVFISDENMRYTGGMMSPVPTGSEISIVPSITGG